MLVTPSIVLEILVPGILHIFQTEWVSNYLQIEVAFMKFRIPSSYSTWRRSHAS